MGFDRTTVRLPDVDVDADHLAVATDQLEQGSGKDQRSAAGDAGLDDEVGSYPPNDLLNGDDVLRELNDRQAEPGEVIGVLVLRGSIEPVSGDLPKVLVSDHGLRELAVPGLEVGHWSGPKSGYD